NIAVIAFATLSNTDFLPFFFTPVEHREDAMNIIQIRLNSSGKAICLRLLFFISAAVLASTGIVYGQNGKLRPEETALKNLHWRDIGPAIMGGRIDDFAVVEGNASTFYV